QRATELLHPASVPPAYLSAPDTFKPLRSRAAVVILCRRADMPDLPIRVPTTSIRGAAARPSGSPADRQPFDAALEVRAQVRRLPGGFDPPGAPQQLGEQSAHLHPGKMRAQTEVRPVTEHEMWVRLAADVEGVRALEDLGVAVGREKRHDDLIAGRYRRSAEDDVADRGTPEHH